MVMELEEWDWDGCLGHRVKTACIQYIPVSNSHTTNRKSCMGRDTATSILKSAQRLSRLLFLWARLFLPFTTHVSSDASLDWSIGQVIPPRQRGLGWRVRQTLAVVAFTVGFGRGVRSLSSLVRS
ncbi:hypothetical protein PV04_00602 [Phialophora macrospora]|uniref:Uncharacterized protein n=1 Tax=Phialophora macrospora TaxID=1851006 RepID=A0A0D2G0Z4_9EURO|nr:hypothetical protein PV04_00602 [Phialophora macrospora]